MHSDYSNFQCYHCPCALFIAIWQIRRRITYNQLSIRPILLLGPKTILLDYGGHGVPVF